MGIEFDIWGNVTKYNDKGFWVKQSFIEDEIIEYKDSDGNYWDKEILDINPFTKYVYSEGKLVTGYFNVYKKYDEINDVFYIHEGFIFSGIAFPEVRRVFSKLLANDIVSVQPMSLPKGKLFYFTHNKLSFFERIKYRIKKVLNQLRNIINGIGI